jgi:hypothetical protein
LCGFAQLARFMDLQREVESLLKSELGHGPDNLNRHLPFAANRPFIAWRSSDFCVESWLAAHGGNGPGIEGENPEFIWSDHV